jgi:hypothetical protein
MTKTGKDYTKVTRTAGSPYEAIKVTVGPVSGAATGKVIGHSVKVMTGDSGHRLNIQQAEAEARAILAAIEEYYRLNPDLRPDRELSAQPEVLALVKERAKDHSAATAGRPERTWENDSL